MTIRNWIKFSWNAIWIGGVITAIFGLFIRWDVFAPYLSEGQFGEFFAAFIFMIVFGFLISIISQAGFFAYLTIHQIGVNLFRSLRLWNWVQILLIVVVVVDLIIFRFKPNADSTGKILLYVLLLTVLLAASFITAYFKAKSTNKSIFISALFFMIVITTLEWVIGLWVRKGEVDSWVTLLLFPLLAVNAYQLLVLPKYNKKSDEDRIRLEERRKARREQANNQNSKTKVKTK